MAVGDPDVPFDWRAILGGRMSRENVTEGADRGHEGFEKFYEDTVESFEIFEPRYLLRDLGDQVLAWGTIHLRGRGSGVEMDVTGALPTTDRGTARGRPGAPSRSAIG